MAISKKESGKSKQIRGLGRWLGGSLLIATVLSGCSAQAIGPSGGESFVLSNDVKAELQAKKMPLMEGEKAALKEEIGFFDVLNVREGSILFNREDGLYRSSLNGLEQAEKVSDDRAAEVSANGRKALFEKDSHYYVRDLKSGETFLLTEAGANSNFHWSFADPDGEYVLGGEPGRIGLIQAATGETHWLDINEHFDSKKYGGYSYGEEFYHDGYIYFNGSFYGKENAIYRYSLKEKKVEVYLDFPGGKAHDGVGDYRFLPDGNLLFNGTYNRENGLFVYDPQTKSISTLMLGTKVNNQDVGVSYSLSPDKKKLLFHTRDENFHHIYQAELDGDQLANGRYIMRDTLFASVSSMAYWDEDSKSYYLKYTPPEGKVESIITYTF